MEELSKNFIKIYDNNFNKEILSINNKNTYTDCVKLLNNNFAFLSKEGLFIGNLIFHILKNLRQEVILILLQKQIIV